jgi:polar amino acid transport system substrate-binding protein
MNYRCIALALGLLATGWFPVAAATASEKPTLIMVGDNWCPYNCAPDAPRRGYLIDILDRVLGARYKLVYQLEPWTRALRRVDSGEAQLLVGTPAVSNQNVATGVTMGIDQSCFFVRKDNPWRYYGLADLQSISLGVVQDYRYDDSGPIDAMVADMRARKDPRLEIALGENAQESNFRKLSIGRMDVVMENENVGNYMIQQIQLQDAIVFAGCASHRVATTHVAVSLRHPEARQIIAAIDAGVAEMRRSGELGKLLKSYGIADWQNVKPTKDAR